MRYRLFYLNLKNLYFNIKKRYVLHMQSSKAVILSLFLKHEKFSFFWIKLYAFDAIQLKNNYLE